MKPFAVHLFIGRSIHFEVFLVLLFFIFFFLFCSPLNYQTHGLTDVYINVGWLSKLKHRKSSNRKLSVGVFTTMWHTLYICVYLYIYIFNVFNLWKLRMNDIGKVLKRPSYQMTKKNEPIAKM